MSVEITGYRDRVTITRSEDGQAVKQHHPFREHDAEYGPHVAATEIEIYKALEDRWPGITPGVVDYDLDQGVLKTQLVPSSFELLESRMIQRKPVPMAFFQKMAVFLAELAKYDYRLKNKFYTWEDTRKLRSAYVPSQDLARVTEIFAVRSQSPQDLVLGGLAQKNIFVDPTGRFKLIDFENGLNADIAYDRGFFLGHMMLYGLLYEQESIGRGIDIFADSLTPDIRQAALHYAGVILLHRSTGWNLRAETRGYTDEIVALGRRFIYD